MPIRQTAQWGFCMPVSWDAAKERELIAAIRRGNTNAFSEVYQTLYDALLHTARRRLRSSDLAHDAVQDVFVRLWRRHTTWQVRDTIAACLHRAVRNRALDIVRRERRQQRNCSLPSGTITVPRGSYSDDDLLADDVRVILDLLLPQLSPRGRDVFLLSLTQELTYEEIGQRLGIARNTVRINLIESRRRLAQGLREMGILDE